MADTPPLESRVLDIPEDKLTPEQAEIFKVLIAERGRLLMPYRVWIHSPQVAATMEKMGTYLNKRSSLSEREFELGIVMIAHHWKSPFVVDAHVKFCLKCGVPKATLDAILADQVPEFASDRERAIYDVTMAAQQLGPGSDVMFDNAVKILGRDGLADLLCLLGYYSAVAMAMKLHRVPVPKS